MIKKNQIVVNMFTNILAMGISMLISIWVTPFLINKLGLAAYGYIGLINTVIGFMAVITYTLTSMVGRFLTVSLNRNGSQESSHYISSALYTNIFLGGLLIPIILLFGTNLDRFLNIQNSYIYDVKISFILGGLAFILNSIFLIFSTGAYTSNRLEITNGINILSNVIRVIFLVSLFSLFTAKIWHYTIASVLQVVISLILGIISFKKLLPEIEIKLKLYKIKMSIELISSGFLNSVIILGNNFMTQIDLIVGNKYLPADVVGMYAAILLIPGAIRNIASALSYAFSPTTVILFSSGNMEELRNYTNKAVKICGLLIGWPVAIVSGLTIPILQFWLGKDYSSYQFPIILMLLPLTINLAVNQLYIVQQAMNKVKIPAIASIIFGVMNILLAVFLTGPLQMGVLGLVLSGAIMSTIGTVIFDGFYTAIITSQPKYAYFKGVIPPMVVTSITCAVAILIQKYISINSLFSILFWAITLSIVYLGISLVLLNPEERGFILTSSSSIIRKLNLRTKSV